MRTHLECIRPPILSAKPVSPPRVQWTEPTELVAWRAWRLGFFMRRKGRGGGPRLLSLTASYIWKGPVVSNGVPLDVTRYFSGIYAFRLNVVDQVQWQYEHCWITGTVALSGRVVEHALGYRAERAVVRELRLGVGTHLAVRSLVELREIITALEDRYQVPVNIGQREREIADRILHKSMFPETYYVPIVWNQLPWRVI